MNQRAIRQIDDMQALFDTVEVNGMSPAPPPLYRGDFIDEIQKLTRRVVDHIHVDLLGLEPAGFNTARRLPTRRALRVAKRSCGFQIFHSLISGSATSRSSQLFWLVPGMSGAFPPLARIR